MKSGDPATIARESAYSVAYETIGWDYNGTFDFGIIARNIGLIGVGYISHMIANKLGANRYMKNIPIVGRYISI